MKNINNFLKLYRVKHWVKNLLIFLPAICGGTLLSSDNLWKSILGFVSFSFMSSAIYIINDIKDCDKDRLDARKCKRPIASGQISKKTAIINAVILLCLSLTITGFIKGNTYQRILIYTLLIVYMLINFAYSVLSWKDIPILEIVILSACYFLRVAYGAVVTNTNMSSWLYLVIISGSLYLGFGKRYMEKGAGKRKVVDDYSNTFLERNMSVFMTLSIVFYSLWCLSIDVKSLVLRDGFLATIPLLIIIFIRYNYIMDEKDEGDPMSLLFSDSVCMILICFYGVLFLGLQYFR